MKNGIINFTILNYSIVQLGSVVDLIPDSVVEHNSVDVTLDSVEANLAAHRSVEDRVRYSPGKNYSREPLAPSRSLIDLGTCVFMNLETILCFSCFSLCFC